MNEIERLREAITIAEESFRNIGLAADADELRAVLDGNRHPCSAAETEQATRLTGSGVSVCPKCGQDPYDGHDLCSGPLNYVA